MLIVRGIIIMRSGGSYVTTEAEGEREEADP